MDHAVFSYLVRCFLESCHLYNYKPVIMPSLHLYYIFRDFCVSSQKKKRKRKRKTWKLRATRGARNPVIQVTITFLGTNLTSLRLDVH